MKPFAAATVLLATTTLLRADVQPVLPANAVVAPATPAAPGSSTSAVTPPTTAKPPAKKPDVKKEAPLPKIPGQEIPRANGTFLGLEVVDGNFKLSFYDKKKKPMPVDVTRATARWPNNRAPQFPNRTVLNLNGMALIGQKPVVAPYNFTPFFLDLIQGEGDNAVAVEHFTIQFHGG